VQDAIKMRLIRSKRNWIKHCNIEKDIKTLMRYRRIQDLGDIVKVNEIPKTCRRFLASLPCSHGSLGERKQQWWAGMITHSQQEL